VEGTAAVASSKSGKTILTPASLGAMVALTTPTK
jgi:hypothetical protein